MYNGALVCTTAIKCTTVQWISMYNGVYDDVACLFQSLVPNRRLCSCSLLWRSHNSGRCFRHCIFNIQALRPQLFGPCCLDCLPLCCDLSGRCECTNACHPLVQIFFGFHRFSTLVIDCRFKVLSNTLWGCDTHTQGVLI